MEQSTFYQQLHELNEQVANMSARHQSPGIYNLPLPVRQVTPPPRDPFLDQISDVQTHIAHLDERLRSTRGAGLGMYPSLQPQLSPNAEPFHHAPLPGLHSFTELVEPREQSPKLHALGRDYMQLTNMVNNLHMHLDTNLRTIASEMSALEDRLDRLEPTRFTPPSSESFESATDHLLRAPANCHTSRSSGTAAPAPEVVQPVQRNPPHLFMSSQLGHDSAADLTLQVKADAARSAIATLNFCTKQIAKREDELDAVDVKELIQGVFRFNRQLMDFSDMALPVALPLFGNPEQQQSPVELGQNMQHEAPASELGDASQVRCSETSGYSPGGTRPGDATYAPYNHGGQARPLQSPNVASEGIAFRDQELSRMDELLKNSQEHLRDAQEALAHQASQLHELQEASKEKDCRIHEWREAYYELKSSTDGQAAAVQDFCEQKDAIIHEQEQIIARGARLLEQRDGEIDGLGRKIRAVEDDKEYEMRQVARMARLLDDMKARQAAIRDDIASACAFPVRSPRRPNGDLRDPDRQLALAKSRLARCAEVVGVPTPSEYDLEETIMPNGVKAVRAVLKADRRHVHKLWNEPGYLGAQDEDSPSWSPEPIKGNRRLPSEARRASYWERDGRTEQQPQFGKPSPIGSHERSEKDDGQHDSPSLKHVRRSVGSPRIDLAHQETKLSEHEVEKFKTEAPDGGSMDSMPQKDIGRVAPAVDLQEPAGVSRRVQSMHQADSRALDAHYRRPHMLDPTFCPPLPVPVSDVPAMQEPSSARERYGNNVPRMQSMQELDAAASRSRGQGQKSMHKHQSLQDLSRSGLQLCQPYVENEVEDGEELGGAV